MMLPEMVVTWVNLWFGRVRPNFSATIIEARSEGSGSANMIVT